jgi:hypothetical protein
MSHFGASRQPLYNRRSKPQLSSKSGYETAAVLRHVRAAFSWERLCFLGWSLLAFPCELGHAHRAQLEPVPVAVERPDADRSGSTAPVGVTSRNRTLRTLSTVGSDKSCIIRCEKIVAQVPRLRTRLLVSSVVEAVGLWDERPCSFQVRALCERQIHSLLSFRRGLRCAGWGRGMAAMMGFG